MRALDGWSDLLITSKKIPFWLFMNTLAEIWRQPTRAVKATPRCAIVRRYQRQHTLSGRDLAPVKRSIAGGWVLKQKHFRYYMTGPREKLWLIFTSDYDFALFTLAITVQVAPCRTSVPFFGQFSRGLVSNYILTVGFGARLLALARETQVFELCTEVGLRGWLRFQESK